MDVTKYLDLRNEFETGDLLALAGQSLLSKRIMRHSGRFSHVAVIIRRRPYKVDRLLIIHSIYPVGVVEVPISRYLSKYKGKAWWVPMDHDKVRKKNLDYQYIIEDMAMQELGLDYDTKGVLSFLFPWINQNEDAYYCSEFASSLMKRLGYSSGTQLTPEQSTQIEIFNEPVRL